MGTVIDPGNATRPVNSTSAGAIGGDAAGGGMKKSPATVEPFAVPTEMRPDVAPLGTVAVSFWAVAVVGRERTDPNRNASLLGVGSNRAPLTVTGVPIVPILGLKVEIDGPAAERTVNGSPLFAEPEGVVTWMGPLVALAGTLTVSVVTEAERTVAEVPLNFTASLAGLAANAVPEMVTFVPTPPDTGEKPSTVVLDALFLEIDVMLPAAS
jgi:hypothetical protein